jgi:hypothetical protein
VKAVADFRPPNALDRPREWEEEHAAVIAGIPEEDVQVEVGRAAPSGTFARVSVADEYADRFRHISDVR